METYSNNEYIEELIKIMKQITEKSQKNLSESELSECVYYLTTSMQVLLTELHNRNRKR